MKIRHGKKIDGFRLKRSLDKATSTAAARDASTAIAPGPVLDACPLCGGATSTPLQTIYHFDYRQCGGCGVVYVANPPTADDLESLYNSDYYTASNTALLANDEVIDYRVDEIARPKVDFVIEHMTTAKRSWLDIGSGVGEVLAVAAERDFRALGIETNDMERAYGMRRFGTDMVDEFFDDSTLEKYVDNWGIISMFGVLEHVRDPDSVVRVISAAQAADDNIVLEVPHFPSISAYSQMSFPEHVNRSMHPPIHLFLFSLDSMRALLARHGYEVTAAWMFGLDFYEVFSTLALFVEGLDDSILHDKLAPLIGDFQEVIDRHELCDEFIVVGRKLPA